MEICADVSCDLHWIRHFCQFWGELSGNEQETRVQFFTLWLFIARWVDSYTSSVDLSCCTFFVVVFTSACYLRLLLVFIRLGSGSGFGSPPPSLPPSDVRPRPVKLTKWCGLSLFHRKRQRSNVFWQTKCTVARGNIPGLGKQRPEMGKLNELTGMWFEMWECWCW